jgi:hypothetical protein
MSRARLKELLRPIVISVLTETNGPIPLTEASDEMKRLLPKVQSLYDKLERRHLSLDRIVDVVYDAYKIRALVVVRGKVISFYVEHNENTVKEASVTGDVAGYQTPFAFAGNRKQDKEKRRKNITQAGYKPVNESLEREMKSKSFVIEQMYPSYSQLKDNQDLTPRQKLGFSIREVKKHMAEIEEFLDSTLKLKQESGVTSGDYWKRTHGHLLRLGEHMTRIMGKLRELRN